MKKSFILILGCLFLFSCAQKHEETVLYYPSKESFQNHEMLQVNLDNDRMTYKKMIDSIQKSEMKDNYLFFEAKESDTIRKIMILDAGSEISSEEIFLFLDQDSVFVDHNYDIKALPRLLKTHYENKNQRYYRSYNLPYLFVGIEMKDSVKVSVLKKTMISVTKAFDQIKKEPGDSLHLQMKLFYIPPIPPNLVRPKSDQ